MLILNVHELATEPQSDWALSPERFERTIRHLLDRGYEFHPPASSFRGGALRCGITFDDCRLGAYEFGLPILDKFGIKATFVAAVRFLTGDDVDEAERYSRFMTRDHLRDAIRAGHHLASHGFNHVPFPGLDAEALRFEMRESKRTLEGWFAQDITAIAPPHGAISAQVAEAAKECGYAAVYSCDPDWNRAGLDTIYLRRLNIVSSSVESGFYRWLERIELRRTGVIVGHVVRPLSARMTPEAASALRCFDLILVGSGADERNARSVGVEHVTALVSGETPEAVADRYLSSHGFSVDALSVEQFDAATISA